MRKAPHSSAHRSFIEFILEPLYKILAQVLRNDFLFCRSYVTPGFRGQPLKVDLFVIVIAFVVVVAFVAAFIVVTFIVVAYFVASIVVVAYFVTFIVVVGL